MAYKKIPVAVLFCIILSSPAVVSQILTVANGTNMVIKSGTTFSAENMTLTPAADFSLSNVSLSRNTTVANSTSATYVSRVYKFSATTGAYSGTVRVDYLVGELNSLAEAALQVNVHNGTNWSPVVSGTNNTSSHYVISNALGGAALNEIALGASSSPLPVEMTSLEAVVKCGNVELMWSTATEMNNFGFDVERSEKTQGNNGQWRKIGFIEGHGTTNARQVYRYVDASVAGTVSYRLKQIDRDGNFEFSKEVEVTTAGAPMMFALSQNYPNPFNPTTTISFTVPVSGRATLKILNILGQEVATLFDGEAQSGIFNQVRFNASGFASGIYFSRLEYDGNVQLRHMTLVK
ncbi:MAG TPA: T9SS type A sorting domain-containing protein [Bacteroidota bacterium]|nr:T9SS type A sorting domain-containing protein [Bacteroidota bacterium]